MKKIKIFAPATVANVSCGFDILGFALDSVGDVMTISQTEKRGVYITKVSGQKIPIAVEKNVAGVAALALLENTHSEYGFNIEIDKRIKPGSGIGSSAASSAGAVWSINYLLGSPFSKMELTKFAMEGERLASGVPHADNVAPALHGGFTLVRSSNPLDIIEIPTPELQAVIIHPQIEVKTSDSREILKTKVLLKDAIQQWGNVGGLVSGLFLKDYDLISRSLEDYIIEPIRSILIPAYDKVKQASIEAGALGCGISGSGPSIFSLCKNDEITDNVAKAIESVYKDVGVAYDIHVSAINQQGIKILEE